MESTITSPFGLNAIGNEAIGQRLPHSKRSALACSSCRSVRQKCDGQLPDELKDKRITTVGSPEPVRSPKSCSRCLFNRQECLWLPSRRFGRPRNDRKANGSAPHVSKTVPSRPLEKDVVVTSHDLSTMVTLEPVNTTLLSSPSSIFTTSSGSAFGAASADSHNVISYLNLVAPARDFQEQVDAREDDPFFELPLDDNFWAGLTGQDSSGTDSLVEPGEYSWLNRSETQNLSLFRSSLVPASSSTKESTSRNLSVPSGNEIPPVEASVLIGIDLYLQLAIDPPPALPEGFSRPQTLCSPDTDLSTGRRSILFAMAAAGLRMGQRDLGLAQKLYVESCFYFEKCLSAAIDRAMVTLDDVVDVMCAIQACSILVPYAYGMRDVMKAKKLLLQAADAAARFGLHLLDSKKRHKERSYFSSMMKELERENYGCSQRASGPCYEFHSCATCLAEALRQAWWELYISNALYLASTSEAGPREGSILGFETSMKVPRATEMERDSSISAQLWQLRIRSAAILAESVNAEHMLESVANARIRALDTMVSNLLDALRGFRLRTSNITTKHPNARLHNMILTSQLMLYGAQIHLHRLRWVPRFNLELRSCSFNVASNIYGDGDGTASVTMSDHGNSRGLVIRLLDDAQYEAACQSISTLHAHSNAVFDLIMNADNKGTLDQGSRGGVTPNAKLDGTTPALYRWPFFSCIQVVAAFGQLIAMTAHRLSDRCRSSSEFSRAGNPASLCMNSHCLTEEYVAFGSRYEVASLTKSDTASPARWLRLEACSNLELSENLLSRVEEIWPFARNCKDEIEACRFGINGIGGTTGLEYSS